MAAALRELGPGPVDVRINSGGGDAFDGVAIHTLLARHNGAVTTYVDGLAASAASFIALAGARVVMSRGAFMMIHDAMTMTYGNGGSHRTSADLLDKISDTIAGIYADQAGEDEAYWRALMTENAEDGKWFNGQEALDAGLVDELAGEEEDDEPAARLLSGWRNQLPARIANALPPDPDEEPGPDEEPKKKQPVPDDAATDETEADADWAWRMAMAGL